MIKEYGGCKPVGVRVFPGTGICDFALRVPPEAWRSLDPKPNGPPWVKVLPEGPDCPVLVVAEFDRVENQVVGALGETVIEGSLTCWVSADTRFIGSASEAEAQTWRVVLAAPGQQPLLEITTAKLTDCVPAALVLDLGNTRTFALVVDNPDHKATIWPLRLLHFPARPGSTGRIAERTTRGGVFDSLLALASPTPLATPTAGADPRLGVPLSFVRLGAVARQISDALRDDTQPGRLVLSSPKRYFWQDDPEPATWKAYRAGGVRSIVSEPLDTPLARALNNQVGENPDALPRSRMLSAMFVELLEHAEQMLNDRELVAATEKVGPRRLASVCATFPAAWLRVERRLYRECLKRGLNAFCCDRALPVPDLAAEMCDEATAVLLFYVYSEIMKSGGKGVLVGRPQGPHAGASRATRIAAIDIGGGTSNLVIADVVFTTAQQVIVTHLHQDGASIAGDLLLRRVTEKITLPVLARTVTAKEDRDWRPVFHDVLAVPTTGNLVRLRPKWARELWFPLAIQVVECLSKPPENNESELRVEVAGLEPLLAEFGEELTKAAAARNLGEFFLPLRGRQFILPVGSRAGRSDMRATLREVCAEVFTNTARCFGDAIADVGCDLVVIAGKTSEIVPVQALFHDHIPVPSDRFVPMKDYVTGNWCQELAPGGQVKDAKTATVLGATIYHLAKAGSPRLGINLSVNPQAAAGISEREYYWGLISPGNLCFPNKDALFTPERADDETQVDLVYRSQFIGYRRLDREDRDAQVAYELRVRAGIWDSHCKLGDDCRARIKRHFEGNMVRLILGSPSGHLGDGTVLTKPHLELRPRMMFDDFWVDSGVILSPDWLLDQPARGHR